jgi:hypothetical protein
MAVLWPWRACSAGGARGRVPGFYGLVPPQGGARAGARVCARRMEWKGGRFAPSPATRAATVPVAPSDVARHRSSGMARAHRGVGEDRMAVRWRADAASRRCGAVQSGCVGVAVRVVVSRAGEVLPPPPGPRVPPLLPLLPGAKRAMRPRSGGVVERGLGLPELLFYSQAAPMAAADGGEQWKATSRAISALELGF